MKLYDRVDQETEEKERNQPLCIILAVMLFMAVFLGLTMLTFNRTTAKKLENVAQDLETKLKLYDEIITRLYKETNDNNKIFIPTLMKTRYLVQCRPFEVKLSETNPVDIRNGKSLINAPLDLSNIDEFKNNLINIGQVHMVSILNMKLTLPVGLRNFPDKFIDYGIKVERDGKGNVSALWSSKNVINGQMQLCALVSGSQKEKK